jgi:hypothetical protein
VWHCAKAGSSFNISIADGQLIQVQAKNLAHLELRLGRHFPTHLHTKDGSRLDEPPSIEGYLDRLRPNTQAKHPVYLATHDGNLFSINTTKADPPRPPSLPPVLASPDTQVPGRSPREQEVLRGARQILGADGVVDLRSVLAVRRAFQPHTVPRHREEAPKDVAGWEEHEDLVESVDKTDSDDEDEGGDEGLSKSQDSTRVKMRRSFELLLKSGHVIRFEVSQLYTAYYEQVLTSTGPILGIFSSRGHRMDRAPTYAHYLLEEASPHRCPG